MSLLQPDALDVGARAYENRFLRLPGGVRLAAMLFVVAIVWGAVLPWLAVRPQIAAQLEWLDSQGVDPSAMYYTELEVMKPILQRLYARDAEPH